MTLYDLIANPDFKNKHVLELLILEEFNWQDKTQIVKNYDNQLSDSFFEKIKTKYELHIIHKKPIEFILWYVKFFDRKFAVNENTLIPRPETEYMIQAVCEFIQKHQIRTFLLDIGTWSGVLGISSFLENQNTISDVCFTDLSLEALEVAKNNFKNLVPNDIENKNFDFIQSDLLKNLENIDFEDKNVVLVANLPYIPDATFDNNVEENVKKREPRMAFVWGHDWLDLYRQMFEQIQNLNNFQKIKKNNLTCFLEMMTWQVDILRQEFESIFEFEEVKTFHFNIRIVKMKYKE